MKELREKWLKCPEVGEALVRRRDKEVYYCF